MKRKVAIAAASLAVCLVLVALVNWSIASSRNNGFIDQIGAKLKAPGDWAMVSDIHPGDWTQVCLLESMSTGGGQKRAYIRRYFDIKEKNINLPNGIVSTTDENWAVMFFYPPNTVEAFSISNRKLLEYGTYSDDPEEPLPRCRSKDKAIFLLQSVSVGEQRFLGVALITEEFLERE